MADKKHRNPIRIATTTQAREADAINALLSRELLYNRNNKTLGIVLEDEEGNKYRQQIVSGSVDEVNITKNENNETKLKENIVIDTVTTQADHNGIDWKSQHKIAETSAERTIILLCTKNIEDATNIGVIGGEILEVGEGIYGHYQVSLTSNGSGLLKGATTFEQKAALVSAKYNGTYYYGIKFKSTVPANIYFAGWDRFPEGASAPLYTSYNDADLSEIVELGDTSDIETTVELSVTVDSWAWNDNVEIFAYVWTNGLSNSSWLHCSGSDTTVKLDFPSKCNRFFLVRCPNGTTQPDWNATNDNPGQIYNKTPNITYVKGTTSYSTHFGNPDVGSLPGGGMTEDEKAEINVKINALQVQVDALSGTVGTQGSTLETVSNNVASAVASIESLNRLVETLSGTVDGQQSSIETLTGNLETVSTNVDSLQSDVSSLQTDTEQTKSDVSGLKTNVSSLQSSLESVQKDISALQSETYEYLTDEEIDTVFEE